MVSAEPRLLRLPSIEAKPKQVFIADTFKVDAPDYLKLELAEAIDDIAQRIERGRPLLEHHYRKRRFKTPDALLDREGIMHLHPLGEGTNELLYLIQYDSWVQFLEVSNHDHFAIYPPGYVLLRQHRSAIDAEWQRRRLFALKAHNLKRDLFGN